MYENPDLFNRIYSNFNTFLVVAGTYKIVFANAFKKKPQTNKRNKIKSSAAMSPIFRGDNNPYLCIEYSEFYFVVRGNQSTCVIARSCEIFLSSCRLLGGQVYNQSESIEIEFNCNCNSLVDSEMILIFNLIYYLANRSFSRI